MENLKELKVEITRVEEAVNHLTEEQQIIVLCDVVSRIGSKEWQTNVQDLIDRMNNL
ncbi:MAG: hypothetical protein PHR83_15020 [Paludibacter sp.]|nr:hypothetical protein [Paludibacter sp.]